MLEIIAEPLLFVIAVKTVSPLTDCTFLATSVAIVPLSTNRRSRWSGQRITLMRRDLSGVHDLLLVNGGVPVNDLAEGFEVNADMGSRSDKLVFPKGLRLGTRSVLPS